MGTSAFQYGAFQPDAFQAEDAIGFQPCGFQPDAFQSAPCPNPPAQRVIVGAGTRSYYNTVEWDTEEELMFLAQAFTAIQRMTYDI